jgi:ABC-type spermidine/putrescine transport system permease subunit II
MILPAPGFIPSPTENGFHLGPLLVHAYGLAYVLAVIAAVGEAIINRLWSEGDRWLPGQLLSALAHGGTPGTSYGHALITLVAAAAVATVWAFQHRDV